VGTRNKLNDLNNHLFEQLERLNDEDLTGEELEKELQRAKTVTQVATAIINTGALALKAQKHFDEYGYGAERKVPDILKLTKGE